MSAGAAHAAAMEHLELRGRGPVSVTLKPPSNAKQLLFWFKNQSKINVGTDVYDSSGDHVFGMTLTDKGDIGSNSVSIIPGRTYKLQMRCNDGNPFNREKCRATVEWQCINNPKSPAVSCGEPR